MKENSNENQVEHFRNVMKAHTDDELTEVLRKRKQYQPEAEKQAVLEAIGRGIINSEQDLLSEKFAETPRKFELFPQIKNITARNKLKRSIARGLLLVGIIPIVWGLRTWGGVSVTESLLVIFYGLIWCTVAFALWRKNNVFLSYSLLFLLVPGLVYLVRTMLKNPFHPAYEILVPVVLIAFIFYGVGYLRKLKD